MLATSDTLWSAPHRRGSVGSPNTGRRLLASNDNPSASETGSIAPLLRRCAGGDHAAFRELYDRQSARLYGIALRITRQPSLAADAVHDALLQVWQRSARFDAGRGSPEGWLTSLVRYRAIDLVRKRIRESTGLELPETADEGPGPLDALLSSVEGAALHRCIETLEPAQQRVILLAFVDGLSHSELAARIAAPLGTVKSWVRRGLLALRECLGP